MHIRQAAAFRRGGGGIVENVRRAGLLVKAGGGPTAVDDPLFAEYLRDKSIDKLK